jgi:hypothetical protein
VVLCGALLAALLTIVAVRSSSNPTIAGVTREVDAGVDDIVNRLPAGAVVSSTRDEVRLTIVGPPLIAPAQEEGVPGWMPPSFHG